ncbi:MAG: hypothetical protein FIA95_12035 [Gemmatimonadetes bacterium]|nr:hypothetical protein [Gemmatimonadota bacterium]
MRLVRGALAAVVLIGVAYAGFRWGSAVFPRVESLLGLDSSGRESPGAEARAPAPSPEIAEATLDRFDRFRRGEGQGRLALDGIEISSVLRYSLPGLVPAGITDPTVELREGRVRLGARVAMEAFPRLPRLQEVMGLLPDTVQLGMEGALVPLDPSFLALLIDRVDASGIPIPKRLVADVLAGLGRGGPASLPPDALAVPLPDGVGAVFVQRDSLILEARR